MFKGYPFLHLKRNGAAIPVKITAEIKPVPLARPRVNTTNRGRYLPKSSRQFKTDLSLIARAAMGGKELYAGAIKVQIDLWKNVKPTSKNYGDADNHAKAILDALNKIVWNDDEQIVSLIVHKHKGEPKIIIEVEEADEL